MVLAIIVRMSPLLMRVVIRTKKHEKKKKQLTNIS
jgi:hypothetical protein